MQIKSFFTVYRFQFSNNLRSWSIRLNLIFLFSCMTLLLFVASIEKELASETFTFFLLFVYLPSQLFCYFVELDDLYTRNFIDRYKWLYFYNASKLHIFLGCFISYLTFLVCIQAILLFVFVIMLNLLAINDLLILSAFDTILFVVTMQLFLFSIICCLNSILNFNKLIKFFCSFFVFSLTLILLFNIFDSSFSLVFNNLSEYIRGNQIGISNSEMVQSNSIIFFISLILIFINYKLTLNFY